MYLYQRFNYNTLVISSDEHLDYLKEEFAKVSDTIQFSGADTETDSLHIIKGIPFMYIFGWNWNEHKELFIIDLKKDRAFAEKAMTVVYEIMEQIPRTFFHNAPYDIAMMRNYGMEIPRHIGIGDTQTVYRQTSFTDDDKIGKGLEDVGVQYVWEDAKKAGKVIKNILKEMRTESKAAVQTFYNDEYRNKKGMFYSPDNPAFGVIWKEYNVVPDLGGRPKKGKRVQFVEHEWESIFEVFDTLYKEPTYEDVYEREPELMISYAYDDVVIMLEFLQKKLNILCEYVDPGLKIFNRECRLLQVEADRAAVGLKQDVNYLIESRERVLAYQEEIYDKLRTTTGIPTLTVGQQKVIKDYFKDKHGLVLFSSDGDALKKIPKDTEAWEVSKMIRELRTIDKWLGTYINGPLNKIIDGRLYVTVDNAGTVSGRVTSAFQQQPGKAVYANLTTGEELFHPRRATIPDEGFKLVSFDYSQQELRVQAYYTLLYSDGDPNLLRAYMPFNSFSSITGEWFDYKNPEVIKRWDSGEWLLSETGEKWSPIDVHTETTKQYLIGIGEWEQWESKLHIPEEYAKFDHGPRKKGKMTNFLSNYGGGYKALMKQLDVDEESAKALSQAYYKAFVKIRDYQSGLTKEMYKKGKVTNLYGRSYYMKFSNNYYKLANYMVQGSSADMIKSVQDRLNDCLGNHKSKFLMPIHDEVMWMVHEDEYEVVLNTILDVMNDIPEVPYVPMKVGVEESASNWADMEAVEIERDSKISLYN